ncbi:acyltransferase family protein [Duganella margarita]|uniref:acyltransferase family protein n=1 Tax=Duganella margarita TaxID=2692170 RepID=UPI00136BE61C|nr:acyltransferase [Duganella margarita]
MGVAMQLNTIQFLRFVAVLLVVTSHTVVEVWRRLGFAGEFGYWHQVGGAGVDIFFVISGFVITLSTMRAAAAGGADASWHFLLRRIIRIVPLYWVYTAVKAMVVVLVGSRAFHSTIAPDYFLKSIFFIPAVNPAGQVLPLLESGWTLSYEMLFYLSFALAIWVRKPPLRFCLVLMSLVFALGVVFADQVVIGFFGRTLLFEFLCGGLIARLWTWRPPLPAYLAPALVVFAVAALFVFPAVPVDRLFAVGLPAAALVMGMAWLERYRAISRLSGHFKLFGDASYTIYLSHGLSMPVFIMLAQKAGMHSMAIIFTFTVVAVFALGGLLYVAGERPLTAWLNRQVGRKMALASTP